MTQTEITCTSHKSIQTEAHLSQNKYTETETDTEITRLLYKLEASKSTLNKETCIDSKLLSKSEDEIYLKTQNEKLQMYQAQESERLKKINDFWANQFKEVKDENFRLKQKIKELEEIPKITSEKEPEKSYDNYRAFTHRSLRDDLVEKFMVRDENLLKKCDPYYYLGLEDGAKTYRDRRSSDLHDEEHKGSTRELSRPYQTDR